MIQKEFPDYGSIELKYVEDNEDFKHVKYNSFAISLILRRIGVKERLTTLISQKLSNILIPKDEVPEK